MVNLFYPNKLVNIKNKNMVTSAIVKALGCCMSLPKQRTNVYVSGKFSDALKIRAFMFRLLHKAGPAYDIPLDWTLHYDMYRNRTEHKNETSMRAYKLQCAIEDSEGVIGSDVLIALLDDDEYSYHGTWTEIGIACGLRKHVILIIPPECSKPKENVFTYLPCVTVVETEDDAIDKLMTL